MMLKGFRQLAVHSLRANRQQFLLLSKNNTTRHLSATSNPINYSVVCNDDEFDIFKRQTGKKILYFTASWCPPCKAIAPVYETLSRENPTISFLKIDIDNLALTAEKHQIKSVPTFIFVSGAKQVAQFSGASVPLLKENIEKLKALGN